MHQLSYTVPCSSTVLPLCLTPVSSSPKYPVRSDWSVHASLRQHHSPCLQSAPSCSSFTSTVNMDMNCANVWHGEVVWCQEATELKENYVEFQALAGAVWASNFYLSRSFTCTRSFITHRWKEYIYLMAVASSFICKLSSSEEKDINAWHRGRLEKKKKKQALIK